MVEKQELAITEMTQKLLEADRKVQWLELALSDKSEMNKKLKTTLKVL